MNSVKKGLTVGGLIITAFLIGNVLSTKPCKSCSPQIQGITQETSSLPPQQFNDLLDANNSILIDVRTTDEYTAGHLKNAKQIDYYQTQAFSDYLDTLDKKGKYLIYCRTGKRSSAAVKIMQNKGFENIMELSGGYNAWVTAGLQIIK